MAQEPVSPPPSTPLLAFIHGEDNEHLTFHQISEATPTLTLTLTTPLELRTKTRWLSLHDNWMLAYEQQGDYSLWNPLTSEIVTLPLLELKSEQNISAIILTCPPSNQNSMLILIETEGPSFIYCKVGEGDRKWIEQPFITSESHKDISYVDWNPVMCNGMIYCGSSGRELRRIDIKPNGELVLDVLPSLLPSIEGRFGAVESRLVEAKGEIYMIYFKIEASWLLAKEIIDVQVYKLDFANGEWEKVESFHDIAFFLSYTYKFSCPAAIHPDIKGNHVYFQYYRDDSLYSFNMEDQTISRIRSNLLAEEPWITSFWIIPADIQRRINDSDCLDREMVKEEEVVGGNFDKLTSDALSEIGRYLGLRDYLSFATVNKACRLAAPRDKWFGFDASQPPWLMFGACGGTTSGFVDVFSGNKYHMNIPNNERRDVTMCYSSNGWCVMLRGDVSLFLWNPFANKVIPLPDLELIDCQLVSGCSFSSSPDSSDCVVILFLHRGKNVVKSITLGDEEWDLSGEISYRDLKMTGDTNPVFYNHGFYFLSEQGNLAVYKRVEEEEEEETEVDEKEEETEEEDGDTEEEEEEEEETEEEDEDTEDEDEEEEEEEDDFGFEVFDKPRCPCESFHHKYLLECDGKLLSVFIGPLGRWLRVFKLDDSQTVWVEVEDLGNYALYVSKCSSFSELASPGMKNRIYLPRCYNKRSVYYCLDTKKVHAHDSQEVLDGFDKTSEILLSSWTRPKC